MPISDPRYKRDLRRYTLATRMIAHEARTMTVSAWTGLTRYQIQRYFKEYEGVGALTRHRGVPPSQTAVFCRSLELECESSALAAVELHMDVIPDVAAEHLKESFASLTRGERLLDAFDLYQSLVPDPTFSLEHALLLAKELSSGKTINLNQCNSCGGLMVVDRLGRPHTDCAFCRMRGRLPHMTTAP